MECPELQCLMSGKDLKCLHMFHALAPLEVGFVIIPSLLCHELRA